MARVNAGEANLEIVVSVNDLASKELKSLEDQFGRLTAEMTAVGSGGAPRNQDGGNGGGGNGGGGGDGNDVWDNQAARYLADFLSAIVIGTVVPVGTLAATTVGTGSGFGVNQLWQFFDAKSDAGYEALQIGISDIEDYADPLRLPGISRTENYRQIEENVNEGWVDTPEKLTALTKALHIQSFLSDKYPEVSEAKIIGEIESGDSEKIEEYSSLRLMREIGPRGDLSNEFWSKLLPWPEKTYNWLGELSSLIPTGDTPYGTPVAFTGAAANSDNAYVQDAISYFGQGMPHLTRGDVEEFISERDLENWLRFKTGADEATESTSRLTSATIGWQGINSQLSADLDGTLEALGLQRNEVGLLHAVWGETSDVLGEANEELEDVASQSQDVSQQTDAASSSFANLQQTDMGGFSAALGESLGEADVHVGALADTAGDLEGKFVDLGEGDATQSAAEAIENLHDTSAPQLGEMAGQAGSLKNHLRGIPANVSSSVNVKIKVTGDVAEAKALGISFGQWKAIKPELDDKDPSNRASGGPLTDLSLVGEEGPELIIDGVVIPTRETRKLMSLGLLPKRRYALGGPLGGGGPVSAPPAPEDFDPLNLEQRRMLRGQGRSAVGRDPHATRTSQARSAVARRATPEEAASLSANIQQIVQASLAAVLPQTAAVAAQAAGAVAPASLSAANAQMSRELNRSIEASNDRLLSRVDRLILETRRMKTYFRDAVRLVND